MILQRVYSNRVWIERLEFSFKLHNKVFVLTFTCRCSLWKFWVCEYSIRFHVIEFKLLCETFKNEKFLFDIQTKCGDIAYEILNAAIDTEQTFKCKWPKYLLWRFGFLECSTIGTVHKTFCLCKDDPEPFRDAIRRGSYGFLCAEVISKT